jgi:phage shock protein C
MNKRLYRSKSNKMLAGVCGGLAEYFGVDPTIIRIAYLAISLIISPLFLGGVVIYIIAAIVIPQDEGSFPGNSTRQANEGFSEDASNMKADEWDKQVNYDAGKNRIVLGAALVVIGVLFLLKQLVFWFDYKYIIPLIVVGVGIYIIYKGGKGGDEK